MSGDQTPDQFDAPDVHAWSWNNDCIAAIISAKMTVPVSWWICFGTPGPPD
jgi:hypothetical protein